MEIKITSKEHIKPSSPTPPHCRTFRLSLFDHLIPALYGPVILFYPPDTGKPLRERLDLLKVSLSQVLTRFYPLAGKICDDLFVDCDDGGVYYVETTVSVTLYRFLENPDLVILQSFLPCKPFPEEPPEEFYTTNIQINVFECGGIAIGLCISHKLQDGASLSGFLKEWAAAAQGVGEGVTVPGPMAAGDLFPVESLWLRDSSMLMWRSLFKMGKCVTKRFVFSRPAIESLQVKAKGTGSNVKAPSRVEAVSSFLWKCSAAALQKRNNVLKRPSISTHLVNIRNLINPPALELSLGNLIWIAYTKPKFIDSDQTDTLPSLAREIREATSNINAEFVSRLNRDKDLITTAFKEISDPMGKKEGTDYLSFSSWCKLGFYEINFGWGKPAWVSSIGLNSSVFLNIINLLDTKCGDGIEAWVTLDEQDMAFLEADPQIKLFASLDKSPLITRARL